MATKGNIISAINGWITAVVTTAKHRSSMLEVVNELYQDAVLDIETTSNVMTKTSDGILYRIVTIKRGNDVNMYGSIRNETGSLLFNANLIQIINPEFYPQQYTFEGLFASNFTPKAVCSENVIIKIDENNYIKNTTVLGNGQTIYFNFNYKTNN